VRLFPEARWRCLAILRSESGKIIDGHFGSSIGAEKSVPDCDGNEAHVTQDQEYGDEAKSAGSAQRSPGLPELLVNVTNGNLFRGERERVLFAPVGSASGFGSSGG
jgi:hypothetical protein